MIFYFCILFLYPETLLKSLVISYGFFYRLCRLFCRDNHVVLQIKIVLFLPFSFSCLITLTRTSTMLNRSKESRNPCLILIFGRQHSVSHSRFSIDALYFVNVISYIDFSNVKPTLNSKYKIHLIMIYIFLYWPQFTIILYMFFASVFMRYIGL